MSGENLSSELEPMPAFDTAAFPSVETIALKRGSTIEIPAAAGQLPPKTVRRANSSISAADRRVSLKDLIASQTKKITLPAASLSTGQPGTKIAVAPKKVVVYPLGMALPNSVASAHMRESEERKRAEEEAARKASEKYIIPHRGKGARKVTDEKDRKKFEVNEQPPPRRRRIASIVGETDDVSPEREEPKRRRSSRVGSISTNEEAQEKMEDSVPEDGSAVPSKVGTEGSPGKGRRKEKRKKTQSEDKVEERTIPQQIAPEPAEQLIAESITSVALPYNELETEPVQILTPKVLELSVQIPLLEQEESTIPVSETGPTKEKMKIEFSAQRAQKRSKVVTPAFEEVQEQPEEDPTLAERKDYIGDDFNVESIVVDTDNATAANAIDSTPKTPKRGSVDFVINVAANTKVTAPTLSPKQGQSRQSPREGITPRTPRLPAKQIESAFAEEEETQQETKEPETANTEEPVPRDVPSNAQASVTVIGPPLDAISAFIASIVNAQWFPGLPGVCAQYP